MIETWLDFFFSQIQLPAVYILYCLLSEYFPGCLFWQISFAGETSRALALSLAFKAENTNNLLLALRTWETNWTRLVGKSTSARIFHGWTSSNNFYQYMIIQEFSMHLKCGLEWMNLIIAPISTSIGLYSTHRTTCSQLADNSTGGALHRHCRGRGLKSRSDLNISGLSRC